jgi:hypothetical protein
MSKFDFVGILQPEKDYGVLYPLLGKGFEPELEPGDGADPTIVEVQGMYVLDGDKSPPKRFGGSKDLDGLLWITNQRIILVCRNYDKDKFDSDNLGDAADFGIATATALHMVGKAYNWGKTKNLALAGHLYFPWIKSVGWMPVKGIHSGSCIRIAVEGTFDGDEKGTLLVEVLLNRKTEASLLAQSISHRVALWHLNGPVAHSLSPEKRAAFEAATKSAALPSPPKGNFSMGGLPAHYQANPDTTPSRIAVRRTSEAVPTSPDNLAQLKTSSIHELRPTAEWITIPSDGSSTRYRSNLNLVVLKTKHLTLLPGESSLFQCYAEMSGSSQLDPKSGQLFSAEGEFRVVYHGNAHLLLTDRRIVVGVRMGKTLLGDLIKDGPNMLIASIPSEKVACIGIMTVPGTPAASGTEIVIALNDAHWGTTSIKKLGNQLRVVGGHLRSSKLDDDLTGVATTLALKLARSRGIESPRKRQLNGGFMYDVAHHA